MGTTRAFWLSERPSRRPGDGRSSYVFSRLTHRARTGSWSSLRRLGQLLESFAVGSRCSSAGTESRRTSPRPGPRPGPGCAAHRTPRPRSRRLWQGRDDPALAPDLVDRRVEPHVGMRLLDRALAERLPLGSEFGADPGDLAARDALHPERADQVVHLAGRDAPRRPPGSA